MPRRNLVIEVWQTKIVYGGLIASRREAYLDLLETFRLQSVRRDPHRDKPGRDKDYQMWAERAVMLQYPVATSRDLETRRTLGDVIRGDVGYSPGVVAATASP